MNSIDIRKSVKNNYDLIAEKYSQEYGTVLLDIPFIDIIETYIKPNSKIIDLGGGTGKYTKYLNDKGYDTICYDFSYEMISEGLKIYNDFPYIVDDMININKHFDNNSIDCIISLYSFFHIPKEEMKGLLMSIHNVLRNNGLLCISIKVGIGEEYVDEPYLGDKGKECLYLGYYQKDEFYKLLEDCKYKIEYQEEREELGDNTIGDNSTLYLIIRCI